MITRVRGTEDVLDLRLYNFMLDQIKHHLTVYNFHQIDTPILEHTDLFVRAVGTETDIVSKEMYVFQTASGESLCLRPEGTSSIIRAYVENSVEQAPWKVFIHGPMFRHERPQKGRWRQFNQMSIEVINTPSIEQDVHFLKMLDTLFCDVLKLENSVLKLNFLGCSEDRKAHREALVAFLETIKDSICAQCLVRKDKNTLRIFDCKNEECKKQYHQAPKITDHLCATCAQEWQQLQTLLNVLSVSYVLDPTLVRGLDYYNKTVFEFVSRDLGSQDAFCGGGRYCLGKEMDAKTDLPSIGVGFGMGRMLMLVEKNLNKLTLPQEAALHIIIPFAAEQKQLALLLAHELQANGLCVDVLLEEASISNMMKRANKMGAKFALIIGPDEQQEGTVSIKNMLKGETTVVKQIEAAKFLKA
jgi:histidyl-tRNA synthetase